MNYSPKAPYLHDGQKLLPHIVYGLPPGMGKFLISIGLFEEKDAPADVDLSHLAWDPKTVQGPTVQPTDMVNSQGVKV